MAKRLCILAVLGLVWFVCAKHEQRLPVRFATWNIEKFPKDGRQIDGAFAEIGSLGASFVAVQEINEPELFAREAKKRLGASWRLVHLDTRPIGERRTGDHIGVLFDSARWQVVSTRGYDQTRLGERYKPTLEVILRDANQIVRVLVVHLKSGSAYRDVRHRQLEMLHEIVRARTEPTVVLGDFNATDDGDRADIARLATANHLVWATEPLACSAYWDRHDGCFGSRLDHVLMWTTPAEIHAAGACATEGCDWHVSCPIYTDHISDHCPVVSTAR